MVRPPRGYQQLRAGRVSEAGRLYFLTKVARQRVAAESPAAVQLALGSLVQPGVPAIICDSLAWLEAQELLGVVAYCLMPDHLHLLVQLGPTAPLSAVIGRFVAFTGRAITTQTGQRSPWFPGFQEHALRAELAVAAIVGYIEQNPVRAGLVAAPGEWPWASRTLATEAALFPAAPRSE